ncbi:ScbA/BarX family gamma-butyrolactone biosynthesis protein [Streptomyces sp. ZAF1911]|uniref:ScbA/BarX family gamma-butyrolactone biosynthesis protein n=1 Tax=Streptomyces sp. ZAF1911 TaxID=2944129 RepID=UPI00237A7A7C|nr:ScbA/BarX family gamma-butyrolactone biosynthesis protein [Streptomyces sp. ZAF1911]MDD9376890.1 ScbA/BarX family gamma-butyrolactone biosynthesis protein [Streptomyces sp. ZAF1911]
MSAAEVHKADASERLLTSWHPKGADRFGISARWPAHHRFYGGAYGFRDPLLLIECVRQAIPMLCHAAYDVPFGFRQAWEDLHFQFDASALSAHDAPPTTELDVTCTDVVRRGTRLAGMTMSVRASLGGITAAHVRTRFSNQAPAVYQRLRGPYADMATAHARALPPGTPIPPGLVGRERATDVVLSPTSTPGRWHLRSDLGHPALFDHPVDHAPGMLLLEAARQAALAVSPRPATVVAMKTTFTRYAEFDTPCLVTATPLPTPPGTPEGTRATLINLIQNGAPIFTAEATTHPTRTP